MAAAPWYQTYGPGGSFGPGGTSPYAAQTPPPTVIKAGPVATPTTPSPGQMGGAGVAPDVSAPAMGSTSNAPNLGIPMSAILGEPGYQAAQAASDLSVSNAAAQRTAALRSALLSYGGQLPAGFSDTYGDITPADIQAAQNNPYSTLAQLQRSQDQANLALKRSLAARGALQSGDTQYGLDQLAYSQGQQRYNALNQFTSQAQSAINSFVQAQAQAAMQRAQALWSAQQAVGQWWAPPPPAQGPSDTGIPPQMGSPAAQAPPAPSAMAASDIGRAIKNFRWL